RPRYNRVPVDRQGSTHQVAELRLDGVPYSRRPTRIDPVTSEQLLGGPPKRRAGVAIHQGDPALLIERQQDHAGRVEVPLGTVSLVSQIDRARGDLLFQHLAVLVVIVAVRFQTQQI